MEKKPFPQAKEYEISLLSDPNCEFQDLREYMDEYIRQALSQFDMSQKIYDALYWQLTGDISVAARKYLENHNETKNYKFSTYFSWYLSERLNKAAGIQRRVG